MGEVTRVLSRIEAGDRAATEELLPLLYNELRRLAATKLAHESPGQTLQATALVHEAYFRLTGDDKAQWQGRRHFFAAAAEAMRRVLVDNARRKASAKHGGHFVRHDLDQIQPQADLRNQDLLALDEALDKLAKRDPVKAELINLRYFAGLTGTQAAEALGISAATADRYWAFARAWLHREISGLGGHTE